MNKRVIEIICLNDSGVINRITDLFFSRGYSISSLLSCETEVPGTYKIYVELAYSVEKVAFVVKLLNKLIDIVEVRDITDEVLMERQPILLKVKEIHEEDMRRILEKYKLYLIDIRDGAHYMEANCPEKNVTELLKELKAVAEVEYSRPGRLFLR